MKLDIQKFAGTINFGTITENDPTMIDLNWGVFVANHSYVNIPVSGSNLIATRRLRLIIRSSTTSSYRAYEQTFSPTSTFNVTFSDCPITTSGTINIQVQAFGVSNQKIGSKSTTITAEAYTNPIITNVIAKRVNSSNVESPNGEYLNYTFEGTIDSVSNHNAHTFRIGYRETGTTTYTYANVETSSYTCSKTNIFVPGWHLDAGKEYDIVFEAIDSFNTQSAIRNIESGFDLMNFNASGLAMAIGKVSSAGANESLFEVGMDTNIDGDLDVNGSLDINDSSNILMIYKNGNPIIRNNVSGALILSSLNGDWLYFRPNGTTDSTGQMILDGNGNLVLVGGLTANGTNNLRNTMYGFLSNAVALTGGSYTEINTLSEYFNTTDGRLSISNGKIKIGAGISLIKVSFSVGLDLTQNDTAYSYLTRNGASMGNWVVKYVVAPYDMFYRQDFIDVSENDVISFNVYTATSGSSVASGARTNFTVEIIK